MLALAREPECKSDIRYANSVLLDNLFVVSIVCESLVHCTSLVGAGRCTG